MKIIILAAGKGQRFKDAGFTIPKPLIQVQEMPLIEHTISNLTNYIEPKDIVVLSTTQVCNYLGYSNPDIINKVRIDVLQPGPAMSAILAGGIVANDSPIIIMDCDVLFKNYSFILHIKSVFEEKEPENIAIGVRGKVKSIPDAVVCCARVPELDRTKFSTVLFNSGDGKVNTVFEKASIGSDNVCVGVYAFKNWSTFVQALMFEVSYRNNVQGEFFISNVFHSILEQDKTIEAVFVDKDNWIPVGTPQQLIEAMEILNNEDN